MPGSYKSINYALRPAKNIERKMLCETFRKLSEFGRVDSYRYVGFGSTFFADFSLFHKSLGIRNNVSMEREVRDRDRFEFNRPFSCIQLEFGESKEILSSLQWDARTIVWLDYDGKLDEDVLADVALVCSCALEGSILVVTVNAHSDDYGRRVESMRSNIGERKMPQGLNEDKLEGWGTADICRQIITNEIRATISTRNGGRAQGNQLLYKQLFNFHYSDSSRMLTVGGVLYDEGQSHIEAKCAFESLEFVRTQEDAYKIEVPSLTLREIRHLDRQLPCSDPASLDAPSIPVEHLKCYARVYRYFPAFVDAEID